MRLLPQTAPTVHKKFVKGNHPVKRTSNSKFNQVWIDTGIEQTINCESKTKCGIIGFSQNDGVVDRWYLTAHERSAIKSATKGMSGVQEAGSSSSHKEGFVSRKRRDKKDVNKLISIIYRNTINPFTLDGITDDSEPIALCNIASGTVPGKDITDDLLGAYEKGFKRMNDFFKERLNTNKVGFFETQTKLKLKTFSNIRKPVQSKKDGKIESFSIDRELFGRLLVI